MNVTEDSGEHSVIWGMFMSSTLESSLFMGKNYSDNWHSIKNTKDLTREGVLENKGTNLRILEVGLMECGRVEWQEAEVTRNHFSTAQQLYKVSTPCIDDHHFKKEEMKSVGELSHVCSQIVLKCLYLARIGRLDILWSVNKLARSITKWTKACDKRLNRLISYIHHTCEFRQHCHVGNTAKQCRLGLF